MPRKVTITLTPLSGSISQFVAFVNHQQAIFADGTAVRTRKVTIPDSITAFKIRVWGIGKATFGLEIDLPGTTGDVDSTFQLNNGYYELEMHL